MSQDVQDLMGRLLAEFTAARDPHIAKSEVLQDFIRFSRDALNQLPVTGLAADIRGMALQMGDGSVVLLNTNLLNQGASPGDHPGYGFIGNMQPRRTIGSPGLHGHDVNIFSPKK